MQRQYSLLDRMCMLVSDGLQTVWGQPPQTERVDPAESIEEAELSDAERKHVAGLMRINHCGEVCAQALYQGQALTARDPAVRDKMQRAALEENDHLAWCRSRLEACHSRTSILNPFWYLSSFAIGACAGAVGDRWSLGFVAETERQVVRHLDGHLAVLPKQDLKSSAVLQQMKIDEGQHATAAMEAGAAELPFAVQKLMIAMSKVMTKTVYYV